jgi:hypothetical protein
VDNSSLATTQRSKRRYNLPLIVGKRGLDYVLLASSSLRAMAKPTFGGGGIVVVDLGELMSSSAVPGPMYRP